MNGEDEDEIGNEGTSQNFGIRAPIIGYEVIDQRQKFTVYKIEVKSPRRSWFVFRRYTDFTRLNDRLRAVYPNFQIRLPGKRWFKDNFDADFIEERARGLQFFINNVMNHVEISESLEVQEFFCLNDPPGPYDSLEESRAYCQHLENQVDDLKQKVDELTAELKMTKSQLVQARVQQEALVSALRTERSLRKKKSRESLRNSADVEDLLEQSEKMANVEGLRGKVYQLLPRSRPNSRGTMAALNGNEPEEDKSLWSGAVKIAEHSTGVDRMRSSNVVTRISQEKLNPRTSTPVRSNSDQDSPSYLDESQVVVTKNELFQESDKIKEETKHLNSADAETKDPNKKDHQGGIRNTNTGTRKHSSKRDSGISVDVSPTPST